MGRRKIFILLFLSIALQVSAEPYEYHRVYRSPYYLGRGDTGIAIADEQHALFYNPAGIAYGEGIYKKIIVATPTVSGSMAARDLARKIEVEKAPTSEALRAGVGKPQHFSLNATGGIFLRRAALGFSHNTEANILVAKSRETAGLEQVQASYLSDTVVAFAVGEKIIWDELMVGASVKGIQRSFAVMKTTAIEAQGVDRIMDEAGQGMGIGIDVGMMFRATGRFPLSIGINIENVGNTNFTSADPEAPLDPILQTVNIGLAYEVGSRFSRLKLLLDYRDALGALEREMMENLRLGAEISLRDYFGFTTGLSEGYYSGGAYLDASFLYVLPIRFDVGAYTKEVGNYPGHRPDTRFFFQIAVAF